MYYGTASGLSTTFGLWLESGQAGAHFGSALSTAGDVNGDAMPTSSLARQIMMPAQGLADSGRIAVYHGSAYGLSAGESFVALGDQAGAHLGWSVSTAGDVNADGYADIVAGAPGYSPAGASSAGRVVFYRGSASGVDSTNGCDDGWCSGRTFWAGGRRRGRRECDGYTDIIAPRPTKMKTPDV